MATEARQRKNSKFDPTSRRPPASADRVLTEALKLFTVHGYSETTIEDIKLQSEVSVGVIYHHFGSKEGIAGALYLRSLNDFQRGLVTSIVKRANSAEQCVRAGVENHLGWIDANRARALFLMRRRETEVVEVSRTDASLLNFRFGPAQEYARAMLDGPEPQRDRLLTDAAPALSDAAWAALRP